MRPNATLAEPRTVPSHDEPSSFETDSDTSSDHLRSPSKATSPSDSTQVLVV